VKVLPKCSAFNDLAYAAKLMRCSNNEVGGVFALDEQPRGIALANVTAIASASELASNAYIAHSLRGDGPLHFSDAVRLIAIRPAGRK